MKLLNPFYVPAQETENVKLNSPALTVSHVVDGSNEPSLQLTNLPPTNNEDSKFVYNVHNNVRQPSVQPAIDQTGIVSARQVSINYLAPTFETKLNGQTFGNKLINTHFNGYEYQQPVAQF